MLDQGIRSNKFNFNFNNRENWDMFCDLGETIARIAEITPGGILVFFSSYKILDTCYRSWKKADIVRKIEAKKSLLKEPKDPAHFKACMEQYYKLIFSGNGKGAILLGVCRARISEGLDFSDAAARCVIIVGIPNAPISESRIILKKHYLDR